MRVSSASPPTPIGQGGFVFTGRGGWVLQPLHAVPDPPRPTGPPGDDENANTGADEDDESPGTWQGPTGEWLDMRWVDIMPNPPPSSVA